MSLAAATVDLRRCGNESCHYIMYTPCMTCVNNPGPQPCRTDYDGRISIGIASVSVLKKAVCSDRGCIFCPPTSEPQPQLRTALRQPSKISSAGQHQRVLLEASRRGTVYCYFPHLVGCGYSVETGLCSVWLRCSLAAGGWRKCESGLSHQISPMF